MKKWLGLLFIPAISFGGFNSTPESLCTPIDLRSPLLGDVRNQRDVAWCYAFTAADMLGYTFETPEKISAAHVALNYNNTSIGGLSRWLSINVLNRTAENRSLTHQTGFNKIALDKTMSDGWCPERIFPSEMWVKKTRTPSGWSTSTLPLHESMLDIAYLHKKRSQLSAENLPYYFTFKNIDAQKFLELLQVKKLDQFYTSLQAEVCKDDLISFDKQWPVEMIFKNSNIFRVLSEQLEEGRVAGLDYDSRVLANLKNPNVSLSELHTSSVVGRRWDAKTQSCQYLIRNSYGRDCSATYDSRIECEDGHLWLGESTIYANMTSLVYILSPRVN